jgi:hypothetical protein
MQMGGEGLARLCRPALPRHIRADMCNLHSLTKGQAAIRDWSPSCCPARPDCVSLAEPND